MGKRLLTTLVSLGVVLAPASAFADPGIEHEIEELTEDIETTPLDARLLVRRADLYRQNGQFAEAHADLALAEVSPHAEPR